MNIALVYGGDSSEREISRLSGKNMASHLSKDKYTVYEINIRGNSWTLQAVNEADVPPAEIDKNDFSLWYREKKICFDAVLVMIHGTPGENGIFTSYLEMLNIPHTACPARVALLTFDKFACKSFLRQAGVKMAPEVRLTLNNKDTEWTDLAHKKLRPMPWFVKPNAAGSSFGVSRVDRIEDLSSAIEAAFREDNSVLIEQYIKGREFTNGIMKTARRGFLLPVTEIIPHSHCGFFNYEAKYQGASAEVTPADIPVALADKIRELSSCIYDYLLCKGVVRIDYIVRGEDIYFLEVNTIPGMTKKSLVPQQIEAAGMTIGDFLDELICSSINEYKRS